MLATSTSAYDQTSTKGKGTLRPPTRQAASVKFLHRLRRCLDAADAQRDGVVAWLPDGSGFVVTDQARFHDEVQPFYWDSSKAKSFNRSASMWGFSKVTSPAGGGADATITYRHSQFHRNHPERDGAVLARRAKKKPKASSSSADAPASGSLSVSSVAVEPASVVAFVPAAAAGAYASTPVSAADAGAMASLDDREASLRRWQAALEERERRVVVRERAAAELEESLDQRLQRLSSIESASLSSGASSTAGSVASGDERIVGEPLSPQRTSFAASPVATPPAAAPVGMVPMARHVPMAGSAAVDTPERHFLPEAAPVTPLLPTSVSPPTSAPVSTAPVITADFSGATGSFEALVGPTDQLFGDLAFVFDE